MAVQYGPYQKEVGWEGGQERVRGVNGGGETGVGVMDTQYNIWMGYRTAHLRPMHFD